MRFSQSRIPESVTQPENIYFQLTTLLRNNRLLCIYKTENANPRQIDKSKKQFKSNSCNCLEMSQNTYWNNQGTIACIQLPTYQVMQLWKALNTVPLIEIWRYELLVHNKFRRVHFLYCVWLPIWVVQDQPTSTHEWNKQTPSSERKTHMGQTNGGRCFWVPSSGFYTFNVSLGWKEIGPQVRRKN